MTSFGEGPNQAPSTPAGWFLNPGGDAQLRYWDGSSWTEHYAPGAQLPPQPPAPAAGGPPPAQGTGCLKAFLIGMVVLMLAGGTAVIALVVVGTRVVHHIATALESTPGRPPSMPSGASDYFGERKQDHVAGSNGNAAIGPISATATNWARTTSPTGASLIGGDVTIHRSTINNKDPYNAALQVVGDMLWELDSPSRQAVSLDPRSSSLSALSDYLVTDQTGDASGKVCFTDLADPASTPSRGSRACSTPSGWSGS
jgi:hypothetical protein